MAKPIPVRCREILKAVNAPYACCDACHDKEDDTPGKSTVTRIGKYVSRLCCYAVYYLHHETDLEERIDDYVFPGKK
jgi:hypothetical protein